MSDAVPDTLTAGPTPRDRRIVVTAAVSVALHLALIGFLLLPRLHLPEPAEPPAVNVDLVPPEAVSSVEPVSSQMPSSQEMPSSEAPSSEAPSSQVMSSELASSVEPPSSTEASSEAASSAEVSSAASEVSSAASEPASSVTPPVPMERPIVIPVGPGADSSEETSSVPDTSASEETSSVASASEETLSAASELVSSEATSGLASDTGTDGSALTTTDSGASDVIAQASSEPADAAVASAEPKPVVSGTLHTAKRFYLEAMLSAPAMARARDAIKKLPPEKRLSQTCNIEAIGQLGNAGKGYNPDALVADALAKPVMAGSSFTVVGGAFRSDGKWRAISYECTLGSDLSAVESFSYRVGGDVTEQLKAKLGD